MPLQRLKGIFIGLPLPINYNALIKTYRIRMDFA